MNKIFDFLENRLMEPMNKIAQLQIVRAVTAAGMASIPFTIVGSLFLVICILPQAFPALQGIWNSSFVKINDLYMLANQFTMGILSLYFCIVVGYELTKIKSEENNINLNPLNGALLSLLAYFLTIPEFIISDGKITLLQNQAENVINGIRMGGFVARLGSEGIFTAILMSSLAVYLYSLCVRKKWVIKMPESVPEGVSRSFTALIPSFIICIAVLLINGVLITTGYDLYTILKLPFGFVANIANSWYGLIVIYFLMAALWLVGIHGTSIIGSLCTPIVLANMATNLQSMEAGSGAIYAYAGEFNNAFVSIGGFGGTLGLVLCMIFLAKSEQLKVLGKAAIIPALFNINEPVIFGTPIMYNPYLAVPFVLSPIVTAVVSYFAITVGLVKPIVAMAPWPAPLGLCAFLGTGDVKAVILAIICFVLSTVIYFPFFVAYDKKLQKEESTVD